MKRAVGGGSENSGGKRIKLLNVGDEDLIVLDDSESEEDGDGVVVVNGSVRPSHVDENGGLVEVIVTEENKLLHESVERVVVLDEEGGVDVENGGRDPTQVGEGAIDLDIYDMDENGGLIEDVGTNEIKFLNESGERVVGLEEEGGVDVENRGRNPTQVDEVANDFDIYDMDENGGIREVVTNENKFLNESGERVVVLEEGGVGVENGGRDHTQVDKVANDFDIYDMDENGGLIEDIANEIKFLNENGNKVVVLEEEGGVDVENGGRDPTQVDEVANDLDISDMWASGISFDSIFGIEEERKQLIFDLNLPEYRANEIVKSRVEVINIASDSEDDVEIIGCSNGYNETQNEVELGVPCDNLSLRLGDTSRYTTEEKGKASIVEEGFVDYYSWLSLEANSSIPVGLPVITNEPIWPIQNEQYVMVNVGFDHAERQAQQAEEARINRLRLSRESFRQTAREFAVVNHRDKTNEAQPSSKKQQPFLSKVAEQLGKSPGPFSDALKMVRERTSKRAANLLIEWRCSEEIQDQVFVPSLLDLSLKALAGSAGGLVSLANVPDNLRRRLTDILCDTSEMNAHIMDLLVEGCPTEIRIKNCSWLTDTHFKDTFGNWQTKDLRVLQLDLCGQCMLDFAFVAKLAQSSNDFSRLSIISLRGACRLSDSGLKGLIMSAPALRSINLGQCTLLTSSSINFIADILGSILSELYIDDCHKIDATLLLPALKKFRCLEVLSVAHMNSVTDHFVSELVKACGRTIKELDLANCSELTDSSLKTIGESCADLCSVNLSYLHNLSDIGIEYLANGCRSIKNLKLSRNNFSDQAMAAFLECSGESLTELLLNNMTEIGPNTAFSLAKCSRKLSSLDISWCRKITNEALGLIFDSCSSLKLLKAFGCKQITCKFLNGRSNRQVRIIGLGLNPLLDHMNVLEPEEVLLRYSSMPN